VAAGSKRVRLDLNSPEFQDVLFRLELSERKQVVGSLRRRRELDWNTVYRHTGFKWEAIRHIRTPNGATAYSLRLSEKIRAIAYRDGDLLRIISLHPDHDSAYGR
jgi:predicted transcriptional regulator